MDLLLLAQTSPAPADFLGGMLPPILLTVIIFYFFLIRPEQKKKKELEAKISALKKHDRVLTSGGIVGTIWSVKDNEVVLTVDDKTGTRIRFVKSAVVTILTPSRESKEGKDDADSVAAPTDAAKDKPPA